MNKIGIGLFALTLAAPLIGPNPSAAEGALAVGSTGNIAKDGFAFGGSINLPTKEAAAAQALATCHNFTGAPKMAALCQTVATFTRQCYALAFDPKAGTPGTGWAIAADAQKADNQALAKCRATAGADRRKFCKIDQTYCDTHD